MKWMLTGACAVLGLVACTVVEDQPDPDTSTPSRDAWVTDVAPAETVGPDLSEADTPEADLPPPHPEVSPDVDASDAEGPVELPPDPCEGTLGIAPELSFVEPRHFEVFTGYGGSGRYRFSLEGEPALGTVHPDFGSFVAGTESGEALLRLTDLDCDRHAELRFTITEPFTLTPSTASIDARVGRLDLAVTGGSGQWHLTLAPGSDGATPTATLEGSRLRAGGVAETVRVRARDDHTGREREAVVSIAPGGGMSLAPPHLVLPLGESWALRVQGGSGAVDITALGGAEGVVALSGVTLTAEAAGSATLRVDDRHTGESFAMVVDVIEPSAAPLLEAGDNKLSGSVRVADLDGDGHPELLIGMPEADIGGWDSGGVFVHRGVPGGFEPSPALVLGLEGRVDEFGWSMALGDIDGDGWPDLVVGAALANGLGVNRGEVHIFRGDPETLFDPAPAAIFLGEDNSDRFGEAVALCDVNGDGRLDLIIGARLAEDETRTPVVNNVGAVYVHLGYERGFQRAADQVLWGRRPTDGGPAVIAADFNLGRTLATGDVDGDGRCDVAVGALGYSAGPGRTNDGAVLLYRGRGPDGFGPGGLSPSPSLVVLGDDPDAAGSQLGVALDMGDLDGDGLDDLIIGQPEHRHIVGTSSRAGNGAVAIWPGRDIPDEGVRIASVLESPGRYFGRDDVNESGDRFGISVAVGDLDGQPPLDLFIGARFDEHAPYCLSNCGTVHALAGVSGALPDLSGPTHVYPGDVTGQYFGFVIAPVPDLDGDGLAEVVGRAPRDSRLGSRVGLHHLRFSDPEADLVALDFPRTSAGSRLGGAVTVLPDLDGDGRPDLAVGAWNAQPEFDGPSSLHRPGAVYIYGQGQEAVEAAPRQRLGAFAGATANEAFGADMAVVHGFAGAGTRQLAVVARSANCPGGPTSVGGVYLFDEDGAGGYLPEPVAAFFGPQASQQTAFVVSADLDGDGLEDLALGGPLWDRVGAGAADNGGGVGIIFGDASYGAGDGGHVSCEPDVVLLAGRGAERLGSSLARLGDLNGDGCEEVAVGAPFATVGALASAGRIYLLWGFGAGCAFATPHTTALSPGIRGARAGDALAAARIDGDPWAELAIGGTRWSSGVDPTGAVWLVDGSWLRGLEAEARPWEEVTAGTGASPVVPPGMQPTLIPGERRDEDFGRALVLIGGEGIRPSRLVIARPRADLGGVERGGAVVVHRVALSGGAFVVTPGPEVTLGGETRRPDSGFGEVLSAWRDGAGYRIVVGAPTSGAAGLDDGAFFVTPRLSE